MLYLLQVSLTNRPLGRQVTEWFIVSQLSFCGIANFIPSSRLRYKSFPKVVATGSFANWLKMKTLWCTDVSISN